MEKKMRSLVMASLAVARFPSAALAQTSSQTQQNQAGPPCVFYVVRHGQTYSNLKEMTIGGGGNVQLTPAV